MSQVSVDAIIPQSGTTITIGGSGDTITLPSGATLAVASGATLDVTGATVTGLSAGKVLQVASVEYGTQESTTSTTYVSSNLSQAITPSATSSKILVFANTTAHCVSGGGLKLTLYRDSSQISDDYYFSSASGSQTSPSGIIYQDSPSTTSSITYALYFSAISGGGTAYVQYNGYGGSITLMEIEA